MKYDVKSVAGYMKAIPPERKPQLELIRKIIKEEAPTVDETLDYNMPYYPLNGKPFIALASQMHHISLYVGNAELIKKHKEQMGKISLGKNCIRFKSIEQINIAALRKLIHEAYRNRM